MRYLVINPSNIVENVISAEPGFTIPGKTLLQTELGVIGDKYENGIFIPPEDQKTLEELKIEKKKELANLRYQKEIAGVIFENNTYDTSRESQTKYTAIYVIASSDPNYTVNWKTTDGIFVNLNSTQIISLTLSVQQHIQSVFDKEKYYSDLIDAAQTKQDLSEIDIYQGW